MTFASRKSLILTTVYFFYLQRSIVYIIIIFYAIFNFLSILRQNYLKLGLELSFIKGSIKRTRLNKLFMGA